MAKKEPDVFSILVCDDWPVDVMVDKHDITISDRKHADDNSITLTRKEFELIVKKYKEL